MWAERILKFTVLLVTAPIWIKILRAMFDEVQSTLRDEGGLFGKNYSRREREKIEEKYGPKQISLTTTTWEQHRREQDMRKRRGGRSNAERGGRGGYNRDNRDNRDDRGGRGGYNDRRSNWDDRDKRY